MFENANVGGDTMAEAISELFRLPANGKNVTIMQLAGFPAEVLDAVVSVVSRLAFDFGLWSDGSNPMLFVCEEAHKASAFSDCKRRTQVRRSSLPCYPTPCGARFDDHFTMRNIDRNAHV